MSDSFGDNDFEEGMEYAEAGHKHPGMAGNTRPLFRAGFDAYQKWQLKTQQAAQAPSVNDDDFDYETPEEAEERLLQEEMRRSNL